jgi:hypothetical protein
MCHSLLNLLKALHSLVAVNVVFVNVTRICKLCFSFQLASIFHRLINSTILLPADHSRLLS